ncbi:S53 family peptidase [Lentzea sp. NPDC034063]|uniref:S53 family peptidase n=1 Tax=unclassified Lentzea TaxID=2643253 RepID=UPI0033F2816D
MAVRPSRASALVGCAALVGILGTSAAQADPSLAGDRAAIEGNTPSWATPAAKVGEVAGDEVRRVRIALTLKDRRGAEALAKAVSMPGSPSHRKFLSSQQFVDRFAPAQSTVDRVTGWLRGQNLTVSEVSGNRHFVTVEGKVSVLESAFRVRLSKFKLSTKAGALELAAPESSVSVPRELRGAVEAVLGLDDSERTIAPKQVAMRTPNGAPARPRADVKAAGDPNSCALYWGESVNTAVPRKFAGDLQSNALCGYDTAQMRGIYGLGGGNTGAGQTVAIIGAYNHEPIVSDTNRAAATFGSPQLTAGQYSAVLASRWDDIQQCIPESWAGEQALDVQAIHTIAPAAKIIYYGASSCRTLYDALNKAVQDNKASVLSNSWGASGENQPAAVRQQMDSIALQAAIQGQAITVSSGDAGDNAGNPDVRRAATDFPASHPWVTAVGGTSVAVDSNNKVKFQTGWEISGYTQSGQNWTPQQGVDGKFAGGAGGGASSLYEQPDYQKGVAPGTGRRMLPDVSALADAYTGIGVGFTTPDGYIEYPSGGTSAAAPIIAALVADAQQAQGVERFGFLNGALYQMAGKAGMTDVKPVAAGVWTPYMVTYGHVDVPGNQGSYLAEFDGKPQSLQSGTGWDNVTGVGTPAAGFLTAFAK